MSTPEATEHERLLARFGRPFEAGDVVFREGDVGGEAFLLQDGRVRLIKRMGGVERNLRVLRPGDLFGESALVPGSRRTATAVAMTDGAVLVLDEQTFRHVLAGNPALAPRVVQQLVRRLRDAEDQIEILMVRDTQMKIVVALLKLAQEVGVSGDGKIALTISPLELSTRVGLDVETVKRNVQQLRDSDYVRIVDEQVEIVELDDLRTLESLLGVKEQVAGTSLPHR